VRFDRGFHLVLLPLPATPASRNGIQLSRAKRDEKLKAS
jgi:hypothetical protein